MRGRLKKKAGVDNRKIETHYVLDSLEFKFIQNFEEYARNWDSYTEYEKKKIQLLALITKLGHRNETLAKLLYLQNAHYYDFFSNEPADLNRYLGKRGKRDKNHLPLKYIMEVLKCSHRTAQAYRLYLKGKELADELFNEAMKLLAEWKAREAEA